MTVWMLRLIGIGDELTQRVDQLHWGWTRPMWLLLLVPLVPIAIQIVRRHARNLPHVATPARHVLSGCRICVLLLLVLVLAGPVARLEETVSRKPIVALVLDTSASMALPAGPFELDSGADQAGALAVAAGLVPAPEAPDTPPAIDAETRKALNTLSRLDLARAVLRGPGADMLATLDERFDVRAYCVARHAEPAELDQLLTPLEAPVPDDATALGEALERVLDDATGRPIAGLVLLSDGQSTTGPDPLEVIRRRAAGSDAAATACPVWAVPVGTRSTITDVALVDVLTPGELASGDTGTVVATLEARGLEGQNAVVRLSEGTEMLAEASILLQPDRQLRVDLPYRASATGDHLLTVEVATLPGEAVSENNRRTATVSVNDEKLKLLYLEGGPRWDFRFLDHDLRRDSGLAVTLVMEAQVAAAAAGTEAGPLPVAAGLPEDAAGFGAFHTVLLGDVSPDLLPARRAEQLAIAIEEKGLGLIVQAGPNHMPHAFVDSPLARLLPLRFLAADGPDAGDEDDDANDDGRGAAGMVAPAFAPFRMAITAVGAGHPALRLYDSATKNRRLWSNMPPFYWAAAVDEPLPAATVLAEFDAAGRSVPVLAEHHAQRGRVLFVGTDSTFLWRRNIGSHLFYRFWGQAIRHVARRDERAEGRSWLEVHPARLEPGDRVAIELFAVDADGEALDSDATVLHASWANGVETVRLTRSGQPGMFSATWQPPESGLYQFNFADARSRTLSAAVQVGEMGREWLRPGIDRDALAAIAEASGGGLLELEQLAQVAGQLVGGPAETTRRLEEELWDNWLTLVLLVGLYCTDVGVRRIMGLS